MSDAMNPVTPKMVCSDSPRDTAVSPSSPDEKSCVGVGEILYVEECLSLDVKKSLAFVTDFGVGWGAIAA